MTVLIIIIITLYLAGIYFFTRLNYRMLDASARRRWPLLYRVDRLTSKEDLEDRIRGDKKFALLTGYLWPLGTPMVWFWTRDRSNWPDPLGWIK